MPSLTSELRQRRVLPLLGAYLGGMWLLTEIAGFAVERFGIGTHWADALFLAMWLLLPSALLVIWRVGPPGDAVWHRHDRTVLVLNLLLAAAVLAVLPDRSSGPLSPETGEPAPVAAAAERPARIAIFTRAASPEDRKEALALLALTIADLDHDRRILAYTLISSTAVVSRLRRSGRNDPLAAPLGDLRLAAQDVDADGYVVARLVPGESGPRLMAEFHALDPDRGLPSLSVPAGDAWIAADALAAEIRTRFAPASLSGQANDPDVRAVTTESAEALAAYAAGLEALSVDNDPSGAEAQLRRAWELDPDFTLAGYASMTALGLLGRHQEAQLALQQLLPRMNRLPERQRFSIQIMANADPERQRVVYEAWMRKFPDDREPKLALAWMDLHRDPGNADALAKVGELVLAENSMTGYVQMADLHRRLGQDAEAIRLLRDALTRFPGEGALISPLADATARTGQPAEAEKLLEEWAQLRPDLVTPWLKLTELRFNEGRHAEAMASLEQAETQASTPGARVLVAQQRARLLLVQGRTREVLALLPDLLARQQADVQAAPLVYRHHLEFVAPYAQVHGLEATLAWVRAAIPPGLDPQVTTNLLVYTRVVVAAAQEDADGLATALPEFRTVLASFDPRRARVDMLRLDRLEADRLRLVGHHDQALARFKALEPEMLQARTQGQLQEIGGETFYQPAIAAATEAGDLDQARRWLAVLDATERGDPNTQLARATVALAAGDRASARVSLDQALATWSGADPDYPPLQRARALAAQLEARD